MSDDKGSKQPSKPRLCERCGSRVPPQKRGRPRRWCSQQCRQLAYEERHGLESWKDKQPKVNDLSDVIEDSQTQSARRSAARQLHTQGRGRGHNSSDCLMAVAGNKISMALVVEFITDLVAEERLGDTFEGQFLADRVARLIDTCRMLVVQAAATGRLRERISERALKEPGA